MIATGLGLPRLIAEQILVVKAGVWSSVIFYLNLDTQLSVTSIYLQSDRLSVSPATDNAERLKMIRRVTQFKGI